MTGERWRQVKELVSATISGGPTPEADRETTLEAARLLALRERATGFLETPVDVSEHLWAGQRLGVYRVVRKLAEGGMATVLLADRDDGAFERQVAIKIIHPDLATTGLMDRFRRERKLVGDLSHPGIARVLDAGSTEEELPYFVMEYVPGEPITSYAARSNLDVRSRVRLMIDVCGAVEYAHRHLTLHQDLKPANILVTYSGEVKLLDFGLARVLNETGLPADWWLTEFYASPEQKRGEAVTTASDIYSLGVVLEELLDGWAVKDLKVIAGRARSQNPADRYAGAAEMARDLANWLECRPVSARGGGWGYHLQCFVKRRRTGVATFAAVLAILAGALSASVAERRQAQRDRREHAAAIRSVVRSLLTDLSADPGPGVIMREKQRDLVAKAVRHLEPMAQNPRRDALLNRELGEAYQVLGSAEITVGDYRAAAQHMSLSADLLERAFQEPDVSLGRDLSFSLSSLARAEWELGNTARSVEALRRQAKALESAIAHSPKAGDRFWASGQLHHAAARLKKAGLADESARLSAKSLELLRGLEIDSIPDTDAANALMLLAAQHRTEERRGEAHRIVQTLVDKGSSLPPRTRAAIHEFRARLFMDEGRFEESMADQATALGIWKDQQEADPANVHVRRSLAEAQESVSQILVKLGRFEAAGAAATEAVSIRRALFSMTPDSEGAQRGLTTSLLSAGDAYLNRDARQAERFYRDAIVLREKLARVQGGRPRALRDLAAGYESLGEALRRQGRRTEAAHFFALSITTTELLPAAERPEPSLERRSKALEDLRSR